MKNVADVYHLTPVQRDVLDDPCGARVVQIRWQLHGELNSDAFERAWQQLLARHTVLRTCFLTEQLEEPVQVVRQQTKLIYERYDLSSVEPERQRAELQDLLRMDRQREFVPAKAPLFRLLMIRLGEQSYEIVLSHHPVLLDARSVSLMLDEVLALYRAEVQSTDGVIAAPPAYRDYVTWVERQDLAGAELYWRKCFDPLSQARLSTPSNVSRCVTFSLGESVSLKLFAERSGLSLETLVTAAWALVLMRDRKSNEVSIGVWSQQRPQGLPQSEEMVGLFANVLPLRLAFTGNEPISSWLQGVEQERAKIQRYAHVSQAQIREWIELDAGAPLFDSAVLINETAKQGSVAGLTIDQDVKLSVDLHADWNDDESTFARLTENLRDTLKSLTFPGFHLWPSATGTPALVEPPPEPDQSLDFSLFYFADDNAVYGEDKYRLYREGALFADRNQLTAVWTPERHFHEKAGLYPNPSVLSGALATITKHVKLRAGSVVLPLHNSLRAAEEWSVVDNLSNGRVGVSFTSGWMPNDFAFFPERYANKREEMLRGIDEVQRLWRGESIPGHDGVGKEIELRIFPKPIQPELPIWLTCSGGPEMFEKAGELGFHCLTALLTQSIEEVAPKIKLYRDALARHGHDPHSGKVTMMMHTFIGEDAEAVLQKVRAPLTKYLKSHLNLIETGAQSLDLELDVREHEDPEKYRDQLAAFAFQRYYRTASLIGTPTSCMKMIEKLKAIGVDEVACLIDFGVDVDSVLESLDHLVVLRELSNQAQPEVSLVASTAAHV
jgi:natural product biosynthesis luciferase-like monooxygenase protein